MADVERLTAEERKWIKNIIVEYFAILGCMDRLSLPPNTHKVSITITLP